VKAPITVYRFENAPKELQALSTNGGDEDWLAIVPKHLKDEWIGWLEEGSAFGRCCVEIHEHPNPNKRGYQIRIGCHS
jgi:hypothetical protein